MTKLKAPASIGAALARIAGQLPNGWTDIAAVCDRAVATCYRWGDPDTQDSVPIDCAIRLDIAYRAAGGEGTPILAAYKAQLAIAERDARADQAELSRLAMRSLKESAEATHAHFACTLPGATPDDWRTAIRETEEAVVANQDTLELLKRGAGLTGGDGRATPGEGTGK